MAPSLVLVPLAIAAVTFAVSSNRWRPWLCWSGPRLT